VNQRPLGATGLRVTPLGLGLAALGRPAYITLGRDRDLGADRSAEAMERLSHEVLDAAYAAGIRYVDAARSYGHAEQFLASWLARREPPDLTVGSKWGYTYTGNWLLDASTHEKKDLSVATLRRQWAETRALLGNRVALYQIHSATLESGVLDDRAVLGELSALRSEGVAIGLTVTGPGQGETIRRALDVNVDGRALFQCVQATWNLLEPSAGPALHDAHAAGWGVIVKEALANGRLTDAHAGRELETITELTRRLGVPLDAFAIAAALSQPWSDLVLSGAATPAQLRSHLSALEIAASPREFPVVAQPPHQYWRRRSEMSWG